MKLKISEAQHLEVIVNITFGWLFISNYQLFILENNENIYNMAFYQINRIYLLVIHGKAECRTKKNMVNIYFYIYEIKLKQKNSYRVFKCLKKLDMKIMQ